MRMSESLLGLLDDGIIDEVVRPLMSGKEAQVYLVVAGGEARVAKVYKEAQDRTFKHRTAYTEGRKTRNTRDQRAMNKRSRHGKAQDEAAWRSTEVDVIYRLHAAGVRVPVPHHFVDGVLVMELITNADGGPAPRLGEVELDPETATAVFHRLLADVVRMLCAGVVHGDLSEFNVLMGQDGPVLIDFPQAVDPASNHGARMLLRDVENLQRFHARFVPNAPRLPYGEEIWELYTLNQLTPDTKLTGRYQPSEKKADVASVLALIEDAEDDERSRRWVQGLRGGPPVRARTAPDPSTPPDVASPQRAQHPPRSAQPAQAGAPGEPAPTRSRRRRRGGHARPPEDDRAGPASNRGDGARPAPPAPTHPSHPAPHDRPAAPAPGRSSSRRRRRGR